mmetsp:Transcript_46615/g.134949  ORF Transcript_46615/g.134949 Transcript_46615/m.134949 type:complete len:313 (-) Transcript_46615:259-1197(-)
MVGISPYPDHGFVVLCQHLPEAGDGTAHEATAEGHGSGRAPVQDASVYGPIFPLVKVAIVSVPVLVAEPNVQRVTIQVVYDHLVVCLYLCELLDKFVQELGIFGFRREPVRRDGRDESLDAALCAREARRSVHILLLAALVPVDFLQLRTKLFSLGEPGEGAQTPHHRKVVVLRVREKEVFTLAANRQDFVRSNLGLPIFRPLNASVDEDGLRALPAKVAKVVLRGGERNVRRQEPVEGDLATPIVSELQLAFLNKPLLLVLPHRVRLLHEEHRVKVLVRLLVLHLEERLGPRAPALKAPARDHTFHRVVLG